MIHAHSRGVLTAQDRGKKPLEAHTNTALRDLVAPLHGLPVIEDTQPS